MGCDLWECSPYCLRDRWVVFNMPFERCLPSDDPDAIHRRTVDHKVWTSGGFDLKVAVLLSFKQPLQCWINTSPQDTDNDYLLVRTIVGRKTDNCQSLLCKTIYKCHVRHTGMVVTSREVETRIWGPDIAKDVLCACSNVSHC